jgi:hypothetical protein
MNKVSFTILGEPASKSNSRRVVRFGGMSRLIKSQKALNYGDAEGYSAHLVRLTQT